MLGHRLRRWPNIKSSLDQRIVLAGIVLKQSQKIGGHSDPLRECNPEQSGVSDLCAPRVVIPECYSPCDQAAVTGSRTRGPQVRLSLARCGIWWIGLARGLKFLFSASGGGWADVPDVRTASKQSGENSRRAVSGSRRLSPGDDDGLVLWLHITHYRHTKAAAQRQLNATANIATVGPAFNLRRFFVGYIVQYPVN